MTTQTTPTGFWNQIDHQLERIRTEKPDTFAEIRAILADPRYGEIVAYSVDNPTAYSRSDAAFFAGGGGDDSLGGALHVAGWKVTTYKAHYFYAMRHPLTGEALTYVEGDVYAGDSLTPAVERAEDIADNASESGYWDGLTGEPLTDDEIAERYDDMLNEVYGTDAARVLRELDPIAYRTGLNDYADSQAADGILTDSADHAYELRKEAGK